MSACCSGRQKVQRWLTLISGLVESLFFTGIIYGGPSLVVVLKVDGYFAEHCANVTGKNHTVSTDCSLQDVQFSRVMSAAFFFNHFMRLPIGFFFDHYGTMATRLIGIFLYICGTLLFTLSNTESSVLLYPAMSCLITSGSIFYTTNAQVGNLFDLYRCTVISIYSGAFDSSSAVTFLIKLLHERGVSISSTFLFLSLCSIIHLLRTIFLMPRGQIPYPLPEMYTYGLSCPTERRGRAEEECGRNEETMKEEQTQRESEKKEEDEISPLTFKAKVLHEPMQNEVASFRSCVLSWLFLWHLLWVIITIFCQSIYLSTVNLSLTRLAQNDLNIVSHYTNVYGVIQIFGVVLAPLNSYIMDRHKHKPLAPGETPHEAQLRATSLAFFFTSSQCLLFCVCFSCPILPLQYLTFFLQVINSTCFYGGHQSFVSITFPISHFGKLSGVAISITALVLLLQFQLLNLIQHQLHGDPLYVYVVVTLMSLFTFTHPVHLYLHHKNMTTQRMAEQEVYKQEGTSC
ncbi:equilibrative nucleobase transporter 1-like [Genypterus blacodes]|uniref:equilibrative nucleobase transporter 1-like n=1 Tax=Genypterus blacodes TaxID=154954 RepID=UPI003F75BD52